jgi:hypothetical protein
VFPVSFFSDLAEVHKFGESWRVVNGDSIFTYAPGETYAGVNKPDFKVARNSEL